MANDEVKVNDGQDDIEDENENLEDDLPEDTDWQAEARKRGSSAKRYKTQNQKLKDDLAAERKKSEALAKKESESTPEKKPKTAFDYAEKAYLKSSGITADEYQLVLETMQNTGKDLENVLDSKFFQSELKEAREARAAQDAVPSGNKRSGQASRDSVDYWINKGELPPADQVELRRKVVNEKVKRAKGSSNFTDHPVIK